MGKITGPDRTFKHYPPQSSVKQTTQPTSSPAALPTQTTMSSFNASTASWDTLAASLDRLSMVAKPKTPEPTYLTPTTHNGWDIANLTAEELYEVLCPIENWREAKDTLNDGWGMPSPDVLFH